METIKIAVIGTLAAGIAVRLMATPASARTLKLSVDLFKNGEVFRISTRSACRRPRGIDGRP